MQKGPFIAALRDLAEEVKPFIEAKSIHGLVWNGSAYVPTTAKENVEPDSYALSWWVKLKTMADLLEAQDGEISLKQREILRSDLFGGMGSLNDFGLDVRRWGVKVNKTNELIAAKRTKLFHIFVSP